MAAGQPHVRALPERLRTGPGYPEGRESFVGHHSLEFHPLHHDRLHRSMVVAGTAAPDGFAGLSPHPEPEDAADRIENPGSDSHCNGRREIRRKPAAERRGRNHRHRPLPQRIQHLPPYPAPPSPYGDPGGDRRNLSRKRIVHGREPVGKGRKRCRPGFVPAGRIPTQIRGAVGMPAHPAGDDVLNGRQQHAQCRLGPVCRAQRRTTRKYGRRFVFLCLHTKRNAVPRTADHFEPRRRTVPRLGHRNRHGQPGPRPKPIDP